MDHNALAGFTLFSPEDSPVDSTAKLKIELRRTEGKDKNPYYIGKIQVPAVLFFQYGISFMVFNHQAEVEELQIAQIVPEKLKLRRPRILNIYNGIIKIPLKPHIDCDQNTYYVGEGQGPVLLPIGGGLFFNVFTSREGQEELQISPLRHKPIERSKPSVSYLPRRNSDNGRPEVVDL